MAADPGGVKYPMALGIAYLFMVGYLIRSVFVAVGLPASVGVMFTGFTFEYFSQDEIIAARDDLQELAFFLVLLIAGLEIDLGELRPHVFVMAFLPAACEIAGITLYAVLFMEYAVIEGMVLASVLVSLGDGLVIPKMKEFQDDFPKHPMPRLVFMWAPLEASFALTTFGILTGFSAPDHAPPANLGLLALANVLRIAATLVVGAVLGFVAGQLLPRREELALRGRQLFNGTSVEAFLLVLAVMLLAFGLGKGEDGHFVVPMGFCPGSLFQPELLVIITGSFFTFSTEPALLQEVEHITGGVWVFGQLVLFSMLGSKTSPSILPQLVHILPIMVAGWTARFLGVLLGITATVKARGCTSYSTVLQDSIFCFLSCLPRATIQGALGAVPLKGMFFSEGYGNKLAVREFIFVAARLYIITTAVCGMIVLNAVGPWMLQATAERHAESAANDAELEEYPYDYEAFQGEDEVTAVAIGALAQTYDLDEGDVDGLVTALRSKKVSHWQPSEGDDGQGEEGRRSAMLPGVSHVATSRPTAGGMDATRSMAPLARRKRTRALTIFEDKPKARPTAAAPRKASLVATASQHVQFLIGASNRKTERKSFSAE